MDMWNLIDRSKTGYTRPWEQEDELFKLLVENCTIKQIQALREEWWKKENLISDREDFELLHIENGGIIGAGDDGFYSDFVSWIVAQGEELHNRIFNNGCLEVVKYIEENNIDLDDCVYENVSYVFGYAIDFMKQVSRIK